MTGPGPRDASRMRIAGVVLLAIAGAATVMGLLGLGGEGRPSSNNAAPSSSSPEPLPGLTSSTGPVPGPPPAAVQPGGGPPLVGTPIVPGGGPGGGAPGGGTPGDLPPEPGPAPSGAVGGAPGTLPGTPGGAPGTPPGPG